MKQSKNTGTILNYNQIDVPSVLQMHALSLQLGAAKHNVCPWDKWGIASQRRHNVCPKHPNKTKQKHHGAVTFQRHVRIDHAGGGRYQRISKGQGDTNTRLKSTQDLHGFLRAHQRGESQGIWIVTVFKQYYKASSNTVVTIEWCIRLHMFVCMYVYVCIYFM